MTSIRQIFLISAVFSTGAVVAASGQPIPMSAGQLGGISAVGGGNGNGNGNFGNNNGNGNNGNNNGNGNSGSNQGNGPAGSNQGNGNAGSNQGNRSVDDARVNGAQPSTTQLNGIVTTPNGVAIPGQYLSGFPGNFPGAAFQGFIHLPNVDVAVPR